MQQGLMVDVGSDYGSIRSMSKLKRAELMNDNQKKKRFPALGKLSPDAVDNFYAGKKVIPNKKPHVRDLSDNSKKVRVPPSPYASSSSGNSSTFSSKYPSPSRVAKPFVPGGGHAIRDSLTNKSYVSANSPYFAEHAQRMQEFEYSKRMRVGKDFIPASKTEAEQATQNSIYLNSLDEESQLLDKMLLTEKIAASKAMFRTSLELNTTNASSRSGRLSSKLGNDEMYGDSHHGDSSMPSNAERYNDEWD